MTTPELLHAPALALYGGTFDPIHAGHVGAARAAMSHGQLDAIVFVPAHRSPLKTERAEASDDDRLALLRAALCDEPRFAIWTVELERGGPSYTIDTVLRLRELRGPGAPVPALVIGSDSLRGLPRWKRVEELLALVRPLVVPREDATSVAAALAELGTHLSAAAHAALVSGLVPLAAPHPASATRLREELARDRCPTGWLPDAVLAAIRERGLYGTSHARPGGDR